MIRRNPLNADGVGNADANKFAVEKARYSLEQAQTKKHMVVTYIRDKTHKELRAAVEKARSDELAKKAKVEVGRAKVKALEATIRPGVVLAPIDGTVVLAKPARLVAVGAEV